MNLFRENRYRSIDEEDPERCEFAVDCGRQLKGISGVRQCRRRADRYFKAVIKPEKYTGAFVEWVVRVCQWHCTRHGFEADRSWATYQYYEITRAEYEAARKS